MMIAILKNKMYLKLKGCQVYSIRNEVLKLQTNLMTVRSSISVPIFRTPSSISYFNYKQIQWWCTAKCIFRTSEHLHFWQNVTFTSGFFFVLLLKSIPWSQVSINLVLSISATVCCQFRGIKWGEISSETMGKNHKEICRVRRLENAGTS